MALRLDLEGGGALRASGGGWIDSLARGGSLGGRVRTLLGRLLRLFVRDGESSSAADIVRDL